MQEIHAGRPVEVSNIMASKLSEWGALQFMFQAGLDQLGGYDLRNTPCDIICGLGRARV